MIKVVNLSFSHAEKVLYEYTSFIVGRNQKVGLVGVNGSGKSTLFNLLTEKEYPSEGTIEISPDIAIVPQEVKRDPEMEKADSVRGYINSFVETPDFEIQKMLSGLEYKDCDLDSLPKELSGGQKTKIALARALLAQPEVLLLDEPTNFMDVEGKKWVMNFLSNYPKTLVLISHDLVLMDRAIDKVLYINTQTKQIDEYKGNYTKFLKLKKEREELLTRHVLVEQKHIKRMEEAVKGMLGRKTEKGVRQRVMLQRRVERAKAALPDLPQEVRKIKVTLPSPLQVGELPIRAIGLSKSYGDAKIFENINFSIRRGERLALIGPNGVGKSTLLKVLMGNIEADSGEVNLAYNLKVGYYSQEFETFDLSKNIIDTFIEHCHSTEGVGRPFLGRFMFMGNKIYQKVETLSGGEKTRLSIALLTGLPSNLLILDEPTTYLDPLSQRVILDTLKEYKGTMIIVSHTPEFIAELNPERAYLMPENKFVYWEPDLIKKVEEV